MSERKKRRLLIEILRSLGRYVRGQVLIALLMASLYTVGFFLVRTPLWWLAGILCGPFHLVPVIGAICAAAIPITLQLLGGGGFQGVILVLVVVLLVQLLESFYLTPKILGRELNLHPVAIIFAVLAGALFFGPLGAFLAAPLVAVAWLVWRRNRTGSLRTDESSRSRKRG